MNENFVQNEVKYKYSKLMKHFPDLCGISFIVQTKCLSVYVRTNSPKDLETIDLQWRQLKWGEGDFFFYSILVGGGEKFGSYYGSETG